MDELTCVRKIWTDVWHPHRCGKPAKFYKEGIHGQIPLCGIHARSESRRGVIVHALPVSAEDKP